MAYLNYASDCNQHFAVAVVVSSVMEPAVHLMAFALVIGKVYLGNCLVAIAFAAGFVAVAGKMLGFADVAVADTVWPAVHRVDLIARLMCPGPVATVSHLH